MPDNYFEADITINGQPLGIGQSMTVRVALSSFLFLLQEKKFREGLGDMAAGYERRVHEVLNIIHEDQVK